jgi:hypothetical protein
MYLVYIRGVLRDVHFILLIIDLQMQWSEKSFYNIKLLNSTEIYDRFQKMEWSIGIELVCRLERHI